jgi:hypothetical protein
MKQPTCLTWIFRSCNFQRKGKMHTKRIKLSLIIAIAAFVLSACGPAASKATPTPTSTPVDIAAIRTAAVATAYVQLTQTAFNLPTATLTSTPSMTPTSTTPQATRPQTLPTSTSCGNYKFISETVPDGTLMPAGTEFTKTWRVENNGSCPWTTSFSLLFSYGEQMSGQTFKLPAAVPVGQQADLTVTLKVPNKTGQLNGIWVLQDDKGQRVGAVLYVSITVGTGSPTPTGSITATPSLTPTPSDTPTETATP